MARHRLGTDYSEVYCRCTLEICEQRDVKGMYKRARAGEIPQFTGVSSPYEEPTQADLVLDTGARSLEECVNEVLALLVIKGVIGSMDEPSMLKVEIQNQGRQER